MNSDAARKPRAQAASVSLPRKDMELKRAIGGRGSGSEGVA
jgi:hypothetical protein